MEMNVLPMNFSYKNTELAKDKYNELADRLYENIAAGSIKMDLWYPICNWLYKKKVGTYDQRSCLKDAGVLEEADMEELEHYLASIFPDWEEKARDYFMPAVNKLVGLKVWATW